MIAGREAIWEMLGKSRLALLDQDGTLYRGSRVLPSAIEFVQELRRRNIRPFFLSNNTSRSLGETMERLQRLGFAASADEIRDAGWATRAFLKREGIRKIALFAIPSVLADFRRDGFDLESPAPDAVVLAYDTTFDFAKLCRAHALLAAGARFIATHPDRLCPTEQGFIPDIASLVAALRSAGAPEPLVIGKPSPTMVRPLLEEAGCTARECVMVGDRLYTDIRMAEENNLRSLLVLTGEADRASLQGSPWKPDAVVADLGELVS